MKVFAILVFLLSCTPASAGQSLMRLFYSPAERAEIDANRKGVKQAIAAPVKRTKKIEVKGYLKRKGQPDVVWVNNGNTLKSKKPLSDVKVVKVQSSGTIKLKVSGKGTVKAKPGQVISRSQNKVREVYERTKE